jgi:hypothetical protein
MVSFALLQLKSTRMQCEFAQEQRSVIGVCEAAFVTQSRYSGIGQFTVYDSKDAAHFGNRRLVFNHVPDLQPVL